MGEAAAAALEYDMVLGRPKASGSVASAHAVHARIRRTVARGVFGFQRQPEARRDADDAVYGTQGCVASCLVYYSSCVLRS